MAHPMVTAAKQFGLRHGEKVAVGLIATLCVLSFFLAASIKTIDIKPTEVNETATTAEQNLNRRPTAQQVLDQLKEANILVPDFVAQVKKAEATPNPALAFNGPSLVMPEPGAGLIRELPELVVPTELYGAAGRGSILVFDRDENGAIVYEEPPKDEPKKASSKRSNRYSMSSSSSSSSEAAYFGGAAAKPAENPEQKKKREAEEQRRRQLLFAGTASDTEKQVAEELEDKAAEGLSPKEVARGYRWVALVGAIDHQTMLDRYVNALKDPNAAPNYLRVDLERQVLVDRTWSDWESVERDTTEKVLAYATEKDEEFTPDDVRLEPLVDFLPYLKVGYYRGVHLIDLVPEEDRTIKVAETPAPGSGSYGSSDSSYEDYFSGMSASGSEEDSSSMYGSSSGSDYFSGSGSGMGMGMMGMGPAAAEINFPKTSAPRIMLRALDFTVEPDQYYRYRARLVVKNPNMGWENVKAGADTTSEEIYGTWSEPTGPIHVPSDVSAYAMEISPGDLPDDTVQFQVAKWNANDGLTLVKRFNESPGHLIGEQTSTYVPKDDGKGTTPRSIDYTSRLMLLDVAGGSQPLADVNMGSATLEIPAVTLLVRNDGILSVRSQALDRQDQEMLDLKGIYDQIIKDAEEGGKKPPPSAYGSYGSSSDSGY